MSLSGLWKKGPKPNIRVRPILLDCLPTRNLFDSSPLCRHTSTFVLSAIIDLNCCNLSPKIQLRPVRGTSVDKRDGVKGR